MRRHVLVIGLAILGATASAAVWPTLAGRSVMRHELGTIWAADPPQIDFDRVAPDSKLHWVYDVRDCEGIEEYFRKKPIPLGVIDAATGRTVVGWRIVCESGPVVSGGVTQRDAADSRTIYRCFGVIEVFYSDAGLVKARRR